MGEPDLCMWPEDTQENMRTVQSQRGEDQCTEELAPGCSWDAAAEQCRTKDPCEPLLRGRYASCQELKTMHLPECVEPAIACGDDAAREAALKTKKELEAARALEVKDEVEQIQFAL